MPDHLHALVGKNVGSLLDTPTAPTPACLLSQTAGREGCAGVGFKDSLIPNPAWASEPAVGDGDYNISQLMHAIKSYFINELRKRYKIDYSIWQPRFNTRIVDTEERLRHTLEYIGNNPEKAGLPSKYRKFPYQYFNGKLIKGLF